MRSVTFGKEGTRALFAVTVILLILDVIGALFIPTLAAEMLNLGNVGKLFYTALAHRAFDGADVASVRRLRDSGRIYMRSAGCQDW